MNGASAAPATVVLIVGMGTGGVPAVAQNIPLAPKADQKTGTMPHGLEHGGTMKPGMMIGSAMHIEVIHS
jgi:hypothetical protein